jgi:toxin ParE1/3/4
MDVKWSNDAAEDLDSLTQYISRDSVFYAQTFAERLVLATRRLSEFAQSGRTIPEAEDGNLREIIVDSCRVMYRIEQDQILILAVMHSRRDFTHPLNQAWNRDGDD